MTGSFFSLNFIAQSESSLTNVSLSSVFSVILFTVNISYNSFLLLVLVITGKSEKGNMESCTLVCSLCNSNGHCSEDINFLLDLLKGSLAIIYMT